MSSLQAHRALLASSPSASDAAANGQLYNVASVTVEVNCSSSSAVPATLAEMQSVVDKDLLSVSHWHLTGLLCQQASNRMAFKEFPGNAEE